MAPGSIGCGGWQTRDERNEMLKRYDIRSLVVAYKVSLKLPMSSDIGGISAENMIRTILDVEYGPLL